MKYLYLIIFCILISKSIHAEDLGITILGSEVEDTLSTLDEQLDPSPAVGSTGDEIGKIKVGEKSANIPGYNDDSISNVKINKIDELKAAGYSLPGSFANKENYTETDPGELVDQYRRDGTSAFNLTYIQDKYKYESPNNIIERTISKGFRHVQTGFLLVRSDNYFHKNAVFNLHWSLGGGLGLGYGKGIFINGDQSYAQFRLWEIPLDVGIGIEIPMTNWLKISGTVGPSGMVLIQNRGDLTEHETGKNKAQFGHGQFASAQFKFNLSKLTSLGSYELFTMSGITNLYLTLDARYHNYSHYLDAITISGTSIGAGFTFELL